MDYGVMKILGNSIAGGYTNFVNSKLYTIGGKEMDVLTKIHIRKNEVIMKIINGLNHYD